MIMHPFRPDLEGKDISGIKDPNGFALFVGFADMCRAKGKGHVPYQWQYYSDKGRIEPKLSYVASFEPWGWILGTGVYTNDVTATVISAGTLLLILSVVGMIVSVVMSTLFISRLITKPIQRIIGSLRDGADQTAAAAGQVSSASQSLAQGASEQAAAIEETTSSVEEMASMTRQNAANAAEAKNLANSTSTSAAKGSSAMTKMSGAIMDIKKSSDDTAKIVKTIDEIAFQTNLLALNAAVEAARAGEAGKGFAVVAEEVRNLAQRSAQAARNTADMIDQSIKNADHGVVITKEVGAVLEEIKTDSSKVNSLIAEIAAASEEQASGVEQINSAVSQMEQVTQAGAATAEESASASEQLNAQAQELSSMVGQLVAMVEGAKAAMVREHARTTSAREVSRIVRGGSRPHANEPAFRIAREAEAAKRP